MTKNPKPLTRPRPGEPNHGKSCYQPGSLPVTDLPMQPSLKEQMQQDSPATAEPEHTTPTEVPAFDPKACILCDHVIVQKILGNKCGESGALCCYMRSCPIEDRKKREAERPVPVAKEEIPCCENCDNFKEQDNVQLGEWITVHTCMGKIVSESQMECTRLRGCLSHPGARAYLNKDVIEKLESDLRNGTGAYHKNGKYEQKYWIERIDEAIALLRGDGK